MLSTVAPPSQPTSDLNRRFGGRTIAALVLLILAIVVIGVVTSLSWWNLSSSTGSAAFYLGNACNGTSCQSYQGNPKLNDIFSLTNTLVLASLSLSVATLVLFILSILMPRFRIAPLTTGLIGSVVLSIAAVYFYFGLPGAIGSPVNSFFGSTTQNTFFGTLTITWGGGTGWFMAFAAAAFLLTSTGVAFSAARRLALLGNLRFASRPATGTLNGKMMFCPTCGSHYPLGTQYCSRDATALKETTH